MTLLSLSSNYCMLSSSSSLYFNNNNNYNNNNNNNKIDQQPLYNKDNHAVNITIPTNAASLLVSPSTLLSPSLSLSILLFSVLPTNNDDTDYFVQESSPFSLSFPLSLIYSITPASINNNKSFLQVEEEKVIPYPPTSVVESLSLFSSSSP